MTSERVVLLISNFDTLITRATAVEFSKLNYRVVVTCNDEAQLNECIRDLLEEAPGAFGSEENHLALTVDFKDETQVDKIIPSVVSKFGQLDILVNILDHQGQSSLLQDESLFREFNEALQANLFAPTRVVQLAAPHLLQAVDGGVIINRLPCSARASVKSISREVVKAGLDMLTKTLANSFENKNVRCIAISSDSSAEAGEELGPALHSPAQVAKLIVFLASDKARYINGTTVEIAVG